MENDINRCGCDYCGGYLVNTSECMTCSSCARVSNIIVFGENQHTQSFKIEQMKLFHSQSYEICIEYCHRHNLSENVLENVKSFAIKNISILKTYKNFDIFFRLKKNNNCLINF